MDKKYRQTMIIVAFGVILFAAAMNLGSVWNFVLRIGDLLLPVVIGLITAFVLCVPSNGFEKLINRLFAKAKHKPEGKLLHLIGLFLTLFCVAAILVTLITMVIPQVAKTVEGIVTLVEENLPSWLAFLEENGIDTALIESLQSQIDLNSITDKLGNDLKVVFGSIASAASATVSTVVSTVFGLIIAAYAMIDRDTLARQSKKILHAYIKDETAGRILHIAKLLKENYAKFFSGQCVEALILGGLILIAFLIFQIPYAWLVAMATAVCALVPYVGAFTSGMLAVMLSLLVSPEKALLCFIVYNSVQFIENQFIYPHVVGGSVGLSPLWTLVAVLVGGNLFGLVGMVLFIPLTAVIYELAREETVKRLERKKAEAEEEKPPETD